MEKMLISYPIENFTPPNLKTNINPVLSGQLQPDDHNTILYYIDKENPLGSPPEIPSRDPQYALWQIGINNWLVRGAIDQE